MMWWTTFCHLPVPIVGIGGYCVQATCWVVPGGQVLFTLLFPPFPPLFTWYRCWYEFCCLMPLYVVGIYLVVTLIDFVPVRWYVVLPLYSVPVLPPFAIPFHHGVLPFFVTRSAVLITLFVTVHLMLRFWFPLNGIVPVIRCVICCCNCYCSYVTLLGARVLRLPRPIHLFPGWFWLLFTHYADYVGWYRWCHSTVTDSATLPSTCGDTVVDARICHLFIGALHCYIYAFVAGWQVEVGFGGVPSAGTLEPPLLHLGNHCVVIHLLLHSDLFFWYSTTFIVVVVHWWPMEGVSLHTGDHSHSRGALHSYIPATLPRCSLFYLITILLLLHSMEFPFLF